MPPIRRFENDSSCIFTEDFSDLNWLRNRFSVSGSPTPVNTPFGKGLSFDGANDYINTKLTGSTLFPNTTTFSCCSKIYMTEAPAVTQEIFQLGLGSIGFDIKSTLKIGFLTNNDSFKYSTGTISLNQWNDICCVYTGNTVYFYINGFSSGSSVDNDPTGYGSYLLYIGANSAGAFNFKGILKNLLIFNRALSTQEISDLHLGKVF